MCSFTAACAQSDCNDNSGDYDSALHSLLSYAVPGLAEPNQHKFQNSSRPVAPRPWFDRRPKIGYFSRFARATIDRLKLPLFGHFGAKIQLDAPRPLPLESLRSISANCCSDLAFQFGIESRQPLSQAPSRQLETSAGHNRTNLQRKLIFTPTMATKPGPMQTPVS